MKNGSRFAGCARPVPATSSSHPYYKLTGMPCRHAVPRGPAWAHKSCGAQLADHRPRPGAGRRRRRRIGLVVDRPSGTGSSIPIAAAVVLFGNGCWNPARSRMGVARRAAGQHWLPGSCPLAGTVRRAGRFRRATVRVVKTSAMWLTRRLRSCDQERSQLSQSRARAWYHAIGRDGDAETAAPGQSLAAPGSSLMRFQRLRARLPRSVRRLPPFEASDVLTPEVLLGPQRVVGATHERQVVRARRPGSAYRAQGRHAPPGPECVSQPTDRAIGVFAPPKGW